MVVPIVFVVDFFIYVTVFVIFADKNVAVIFIVGHNLVQVAMWFIHDCQLRVATGKPENGNQGDCDDRHPVEPARSQYCAQYLSLHFGVPSVLHSG